MPAEESHISSNINSGINQLEKLRVLVPSTTPPKVLNRNRIELMTKKNGKPDLTRKRSSPLILRKASSEPLLPCLPYEENYTQLLFQRKLQSNAQITNSVNSQIPPGANNSNRNWTYQGRFKKDPQKRRSQQLTDPEIETDTKGIVERLPETPSENQSTENDKNSQSVVEKSDQQAQSVTSEEDDVSLNKIDSEHEERFLRDLGWRPEDEEHVPELTEQEIMEGMSSIQLDNNESKSSTDSNHITNTKQINNITHPYVQYVKQHV